MAAYVLKPKAYNKIAYYMLGVGNPRPGDGTFTSAMREAQRGYGAELYLCTANSAVPLADAIRGYYVGQREAVPSIGYIRADSTAASPHTPEDSRMQLERIESEKQRLAPIVKTVGSVCVVEQYYSSKQTIRFAEQILTDLGVQSISVVAGQWFHDAYPETLDLDAMTSTDSEFMFAIGKCAAWGLGPEYLSVEQG